MDFHGTLFDGAEVRLMPCSSKDSKGVLLVGSANPFSRWYMQVDDK